MQVVDPLHVLMKLQAPIEELDHRVDEVQLKYGIFFDMSEIGDNRVVGLNEMRVFIAKLDLANKDEAI